MLENRGLAGIVLDLNRKSQLWGWIVWGGREGEANYGMGRTGVVVSQGLWEDKVAVRRRSPAEHGVGGRLRATFTVQRGRPPSAPAFSCWKDLSEGWGLPGEGMADWEPSLPLWLALLKICRTLHWSLLLPVRCLSLPCSVSEHPGQMPVL